MEIITQYYNIHNIKACNKVIAGLPLYYIIVLYYDFLITLTPSIFSDFCGINPSVFAGVIL